MKALLGVWIAALAAAAVWIGWDAYQGGKPAIGGPFALTDQDGRTVTSDSLKGKPTLIYFGFTYCPDVCPTSLLLMENAIEKLGPDAAKKVNLVFITVDPERDTPAQLAQYVPSFHPRLIGLTGTAEQIAAVQKAYRVYAKKVADDKSSAGFTFDHTSIMYLMDPKGQYVAHFTHATPVDRIAERLRKAL
jgi:cytochrome oxidase Cu insertion factor (SCO1/SenC/PrrC family)